MLPRKSFSRSLESEQPSEDSQTSSSQPTLTSSKPSLTNLPQLRAKAPKLPVDTYITRVESTVSDSEDDLTEEEFVLEQIGSKQEKIGYISQYISYEHPDILLKTIYSAAGSAIKRYSFRSVLLAAKTVRKLDDSTLFPRFLYACKSFYATESSHIDTPLVVSTMKKREDLGKMRSLLKNKDETLIDFLLEGAITKEQYEQAKVSGDKGEALIREVVMNGSSGTA
jgi:hypothetical protein